MTTFSPERLQRARQRNKLSAKELANATGQSPAMLSRIERGTREPSDEEVNLFSVTLGFDQEFFYLPAGENIKTDAASFRSLARMTARERDAALAAGELGFDLMDYVHAHYNLPAPNLPQDANATEPALAARELRSYWGLGEKPIGHMIRLLEHQGIRVFSLAESGEAVDAFSLWRQDEPYIFLNTMKTAEHQRFDAAHELGHLVLHRHAGTESRDTKQAEAEANAFASAFLMPRADVIAKLPIARSLEQLMHHKKRWGVSLAALAYRLHQIDVISEWQKRGFFIEIGKRGFKRAEPLGIEWERSTVWDQIMQDLWDRKLTVEALANSLHLPAIEIQALTFRTTPSKRFTATSMNKPRLL